GTAVVCTRVDSVPTFSDVARLLDKSAPSSHVGDSRSQTPRVSSRRNVQFTATQMPPDEPAQTSYGEERAVATMSAQMFITIPVQRIRRWFDVCASAMGATGPA